MPSLRLWLRRARREPGATATTVAVLALGVAANVVVFQAIDRLVLNPLPLPDAREILAIGSEMPEIERGFRTFEALSGPEIASILEATRTLRDPLAFDLNSVRTSGAEYPLRLFAGFVWTDPLPLLGVGTLLGRSFTADELARGGRVIVLSHASWSGDFGADSSIVGHTVPLDDAPHTVVGVLPPYASIYGVDLWLPMPEPLAGLSRERRQFNLLARADDPEAVALELTDLAGRIADAWGAGDPAYDGWRLRATSFARGNAAGFRSEATLTWIATLFVLGLVGLNLGSLALARGVRERPESATRLALGAGRARLALDAVAEGMALAVLAGLLGVGLAALGFELLGRRLPGLLQPQGSPLALERTGVVFGLGITLVAGGLLAALSAGARLGARAGGTLASVQRGGGSRGLRRLQKGMVALQLALGLALVSGGGMVALGIARILAEDPGFAAEELVSMRVTLPAPGYEGESVPGFFEALLERLAATPGVDGATVATQVAPTTLFSAEVETPTGDDATRLFHTVVGDGYFGTLGIPIRAGRPLDARDRTGGPAAVVVNEAAAERLYPGEEALGRPIRVRGTNFDSGWGEIVGISRTVRNRGRDDAPAPEVFTAHRQAGARYRQMFVIGRSAEDPAALVPVLRRAVQALDPGQPVYSIGTGRGALEAEVASRRLAAALVLGLAVAAVGLAALGLHGLLAYTVASRRKELAIRAAVGADPGTLRRALLGESLGIAAVGLATGWLLTGWLGAALRATLAGAAEWSTAVVAGASLLLVLVVLGAALRPARAAARTEPARILRT